MSKFANSYWDHTGKFQTLADKLNELVPVSGAVSNPRGANRRLEKFRVASNAYYDIFNNGGMNRAGLIRRIFNLGSREYCKHTRYGSHFRWERALAKTEPTMDRIILAAAVEQGLLDQASIESVRVLVD